MSLCPETARNWSAAYEDLKCALVAAQDERHKRQDWIEEPGGREIGWVVHERQVMTDRVNLLRSRNAEGPVSIADVARKEQSACGHSDYTTKYAIGCADLVYRPGATT